MKGFENLYGQTRMPEEISQVPLSKEDISMLCIDTAEAIAGAAIPDSIKAVVILANKVAALDAAVSTLSRRQPFAPLNGVFENMDEAIEQLSESCTALFEFANANYVLEVLDPDFSDSSEDD